jgi:hypothetical protein
VPEGASKFGNQFFEETWVFPCWAGPECCAGMDGCWGLLALEHQQLPHSIWLHSVICLLLISAALSIPPDIHKNKTNSVVFSPQANLRLSGRRLPEKLVPTFAGRGCRVVSATGPCGRYSRFSRSVSDNASSIEWWIGNNKECEDRDPFRCAGETDDISWFLPSDRGLFRCIAPVCWRDKRYFLVPAFAISSICGVRNTLFVCSGWHDANLRYLRMLRNGATA